MTKVKTFSEACKIIENMGYFGFPRYYQEEDVWIVDEVNEEEYTRAVEKLRELRSKQFEDD